MKDLDLTEILKDCPKGTKLWSPLFGTVFLEEINTMAHYSICVVVNNEEQRFTSDGKYFEIFEEGECMIFPSKDNRNWSNFKVSVEKFDIKELKPFDKVLSRDTNTQLWGCDLFGYFTKDSYPFNNVAGIYKQCIPYNDETKHLLGTTGTPPEKYINW